MDEAIAGIKKPSFLGGCTMGNFWEQFEESTTENTSSVENILNREETANTDIGTRDAEKTKTVTAEREDPDEDPDDSKRILGTRSTSKPDSKLECGTQTKTDSREEPDEDPSNTGTKTSTKTREDPDEDPSKRTFFALPHKCS